jgi:hypothetical protein
MIVDESKVKRQALSCFMLAFVKCTKIYFLEVNDTSCYFAHFKQC